MLAHAVAKHLAAEGIVTYSQVAGGDVFVQTMPSTPDAAVCVAGYGAQANLTRSPDDAPLLQVKVRGAAKDAVGSYARARRVYDALACLGPALLDEGGDDEVFVIGATPVQSDAIPLGVDENDRPEWVVNVAFLVAAPTTHRPAY